MSLICARCTWPQGWIGFEEWVLSLCAFLGALELDDLIDFSMRLFDWWGSRAAYTHSLPTLTPHIAYPRLHIAYTRLREEKYAYESDERVD